MAINTNPLKILLVDDDDDFIRYFLSVSSSYDVQVDICKRVDDAIRQIEEKSYNCYVIDLQLPDGLGCDIIRHIRQHNQKLIAVVTGVFNDEESFRKLKEKYDVRYILDKPIYHNQIEKFLSTLISNEEKCTIPGDRIKKLQQDYQKTICDKVDLISDLIDQVKHLPGQESLTALKNALHKIGGSAGTFGYREVTEACRSLEQEIKKIIESGGEIPKTWIANLDDFLHKFKYYFQFYQNEENAGQDKSSPPSKKSEVRTTLFVVDPDESFLHLLEGQKESFRLNLVTENDPEHARSLLLSPDFNPRAVIISEKLPGFQRSGTELILEMQKKENYLPAIFGLLSDEDDVDLRVRSVKNGIQYYFVKPISPIAVLETMQDEIAFPNTEQYKVLVLDDDEDICKCVKDSLGEVGIEVRAIYNPEKLFGELEEFNPHILLLDVLLPKYDGLSLLKTLRADPLCRDLAIVIITHFMDTLVSEVAYAQNVLDIIYKPFDKNLLKKNILELVKKRVKQGRFTPNKSRTGLDSVPVLCSSLQSIIRRKEFENTYFILFELERFGNYALEEGRAFANHLLVSVANLLVQAKGSQMMPFFIEPSKFAVIASGTSAKKVEDEMRNFLIKARREVNAEITLRAGIIPLSDQFKECREILIAAEQSLEEARSEGMYSPVKLHLSEKKKERVFKPEVLLIDPDEDIQLMIGNALGNQEIRVRPFKEGDEALRAIRKYQEPDLPALIIIERNLPDMDGLKVLDAVIERYHQKIPCFFLTVYSSDQDISTGLKHGVADYITKPFNLTIFLQKVMAAAFKQSTLAQSDKHG